MSAQTLLFSSDSLIFLFTAVGVICCTLILLLYLKSKQTLNKMEQVNLENSSSKGLDLLKGAMKKAENVLSQAELESIKLAQTSKLQTNKLAQEYDAQLKESLASLQNQLLTYLHDLELAAGQSQTQAQAYMSQRVNEAMDKFETKLSELLNQTQAKSFESIELELKSTRNLIDTYKTQQLTLIDENVIAMLERTLSLVLSKKLTLRDQVDLVYEALEKAKAEKFIV